MEGSALMEVAFSFKVRAKWKLTDTPFSANAAAGRTKRDQGNLP